MEKTHKEIIIYLDSKNLPTKIVILQSEEPNRHHTAELTLQIMGQNDIM